MERSRAIALGALIFILVGLPIGYLGGGDDENGDVVSMIVVGVVLIAILLVLFLRFVPRFESEAGTDTLARNALIFSIVALVLVVVFWTGLPIVLGAAGLELGLVARERGRPSDQGRATAASVIGALAAVRAFLGLLLG